jgi:ribose transport system substrate-binding protein
MAVPRSYCHSNGIDPLKRTPAMKKLRFLVSLLTKNNDYQLEQAVAAQRTSTDLGVETQIIFADNDPITQSTQILRVIQSDPILRPDAIVCEPVGGTALPQVARAATAAGLGWVVLNRDADYMPELRKTHAAPIFSVSSDQKEVGRIQGRQFAALLPRGGTILYIQGPSENAVAKERFAGMQTSLPPNIHVTSLRGQWTEESAQRSVASWIRLNSASRTPIDLIGAQNDAMAMGARKAFGDVQKPMERDRWMSLPFTGVDGVPKTGQAWVRTGSLTATVITPPTAGQALSMLARAIESGSKPAERSFTTAESFPPIEQLSRK